MKCILTFFNLQDLILTEEKHTHSIMYFSTIKQIYSLNLHVHLFSNFHIFI